MKVSLIKIGNSQGIRIPKTLIEQCGFGDELELEVKGGGLLLRPAEPSRKGWEEVFQKKSVPERPLLPDHLSEDWDDREWTW